MCKFQTIVDALDKVIEMVNYEIENKEPYSKNSNFADVTVEMMILQRLCSTAQYIENIK